MALLEGLGLVKNFGGVRALAGVDIRVHRDEVLGLIGPNGSGKTTLFNVITGFFPPSAGEVFWEGRVLTRTPFYRRARMGLVRTFQERMIFPRLTVRTNIQIALDAAASHGNNSYDVQGLAEYARLSHLIDSRAQDLSWGQTRLLGIALALALTPKLLLLDEPFAGLSPAAAAEVTETVKQLRSDGYALCIIDHEMAYLLPLCDRIVVLNNGLAVADGSPEAVMKDGAVRAAYLGV